MTSLYWIRALLKDIAGAAMLVTSHTDGLAQDCSNTSAKPSIRSSLCNSSEAQAPIDFIYKCKIYKCPIFKWIAVTCLKNRTPGSSPSKGHQGDMAYHSTLSPFKLLSITVFYFPICLTHASYVMLPIDTDNPYRLSIISGRIFVVIFQQDDSLWGPCWPIYLQRKPSLNCWIVVERAKIMFISIHIIGNYKISIYRGRDR